MTTKDKNVQENSKDALIIAYYLSKCNKEAVKALGYKSYNNAYSEIGDLLGIKKTTIKNMRDQFDPYVDNGRKGWHQRKLSSSRQEVYDSLKDCSDSELEQLAKNILKKYDDKNKNIALSFSEKESGIMFNSERFKEILENYKRDFNLRWENEKFKWEAVKTFQDNWDIDAADFGEMLTRSLSKTYNLLASTNNFPARMIIRFAGAAPEEVRAMFKSLYDENRDVIDRISEFKEKSSDLLKKYGNGAANHYQNENAVTTYLWLRYPDKYYIYKYSEIKKVADILDCGYHFKKGAYRENLENFFVLYDELCEFINTDENLKDLIKARLSEQDSKECYSDPAHKTLTIDVGFYISRNYSSLEQNDLPDEQASDSTPEFLSGSLVTENENIKYDKAAFLDEVFMSDERYDKMYSVLENKKNIILQGAPGVGKTYMARRLAYSIMGEMDEDRIKFVQFHQNYSYEDFVMGYKPTEEGGFQLKKGIFYQFCKKAENQPDKEFFFLIDEINRGNMSKIFGELLMLIESDYRGKGRVNLAYNDELFSIPENLYIIGMMNTADRSLAMIDYALRRRFSFFEIDPAFDSEGFKKYQAGLSNETFDRLIDKVKELNQKITNDPSLGKGFCIGHSYFSNWKEEECTDEKMLETVDFEIMPMLEEYWFDDNKELQTWDDELHGVFQ